MSEFFQQMAALLKACWPEIAAIEWLQYGNSENLRAWDLETGFPKATGMLLCTNARPIVGANVQAFGFLSDPGKSSRIVATKLSLLDENPQAKSSMEVRNPAIGHWSGGIRSSYFSHEGCAITGLPEIGDHLVNARAMREFDMLTKEDSLALTDPNTRHMIEAREYVNMTVSQFGRLKLHIFDIMQRGLHAINTAA